MNTGQKHYHITKNKYTNTPLAIMVCKTVMDYVSFHIRNEINQVSSAFFCKRKGAGTHRGFYFVAREAI